MLKCIVLLLITVLHYSLAFPRCYWDIWRGWQGCDPDQDDRGCYWDQSHGWQGCEPDNEGSENYPYTCPEGQSLLSTEDVIDMIDYIAERLHLEENIFNDYNYILENSTHNCLKELNDFHEQLVDRPKHIEHILEEMANKRRILESVVHELAGKVEEIDKYSGILDLLAENSDQVLTKFEMYKNICQFNCEDSEIDEWRGYKKYLRTISDSSSKVCWKIKDLYNEITQQLTDFREEIDQQISGIVYSFGDKCNDFVLTYKQIWKEAAIKHYGTVMYDILSLQDDYYHFALFITNVNGSSHFEKLEENISKVEEMLLKLESDVYKYGIHCMNCNNNRRIKRDDFGARIGWDNYENYDDYSNIVHNLIYDKTESIRKTIGNNFGKYFKDISEYNTSNPENIAMYDINELLPIYEVVNNIEKEKEAFERLKSLLPDYSMNKTMDLVYKSEEILANLENAERFIDVVLTW